MKHNYLFLLLIGFLFVGCQPQTKLSESSKLSSNGSNTFDYNGFILDFPISLQNDMYYWTKGNLNFTPKDFEISGRDRKGVFTIDKKIYPIFHVKFEEEVEILKVKFKILPFKEKAKEIYENNPVYLAIDSFRDFITFNINEPSNIEIYNSQNKGQAITLNRKIYDSRENAYIIKEPFNDKTKDVVLIITKLHGFQESGKREVIYLPDELSFLVKNNNIANKIIKYNLKNSKDLNRNEELIRFIALHDVKLFRELQKEKNEYQLDEISFLKLPLDININYAFDNFSNIISTGEYKDVQNRNKSFNASKVYPNLDYNKYGNSRNIQIQENNKALKLSDKDIQNNKIETNGFTDFADKFENGL